MLSPPGERHLQQPSKRLGFVVHLLRATVGCTKTYCPRCCPRHRHPTGKNKKIPKSFQHIKIKTRPSQANHLAAYAVVTLLEGLLLLLLLTRRSAFAPSCVRPPVKGIVFNVATLKSAMSTHNIARKPDVAERGQGTCSESESSSRSNSSSSPPSTTSRSPRIMLSSSSLIFR
jgi:hypothetical protein